MKRSARFDIGMLFVIALVLFCSPLGLYGQSLSEPMPKPKSAKSLMLKQAQRKMESLKQSVSRAKQRVEEFEKTLAGNRAELNKQYENEAQLGISLESYPDVIRTLQTHRVELLIELAGLDAKRKLLSESMSAQKRPEEKMNDSQVEQKRVLQLQQQRLEKLEKLAAEGSVSQEDVLEAKIEFGQMRLRFAEANQEAAVKAPQNELLELSLEKAEQTARLQKVEELLASFTKARVKLSKREQISRRIEVSQDQLSTAQDRLFEREDDLSETRKFIEQLTGDEEF